MTVAEQLPETTDATCLYLDKDGAQVRSAHKLHWVWIDKVWTDDRMCSTCGHVMKQKPNSGD